MKQIVQFVEIQRDAEWRPVPDHFEFVPAGRLQWLQRLAWRFLNWRGVLKQATREHVTFTQHVIDTGDVMERLYRARAAMFDGGREPREVLIGSEDFAELMGSAPVRQAMDFDCEYRRNRTLMGLKVRVIPWMRGVLVMP
jgi:hypothetical protein